MNKFLKRVRNRVIRDIYDTSWMRSCAERAYQTAVESYAGNLPLISQNDRNLVETLRDEGVYVTSLSALGIPSMPPLLQSAKKIISQIPKTRTGKKNEYFVLATPQQITENSEIFMWGMQERLLNIIENYMSLPLAYHGSYFRRDLVNDVKVKTRLWHKDIEDPHMIKIIVYLNDVDDDGGPFQYIPKSLSAKLSQTIKYKFGQIPDKTMQQVSSPSDWITCPGKAGTVIIAATGSVLHKGKIPVAKDRFSIFFDYTSRQPRFPFYCKSCLPAKYLLALTSNFSERQMQCVFWRQHSLQEIQISLGIS